MDLDPLGSEENGATGMSNSEFTRHQLERVFGVEIF